MNNHQKYGAVAALIAAATFIVGFAMYFTLLAAANYGSLSVDPLKHVAFLAEHKAIMHAWNFIIYVAFGIVLVVLALALYERLKTSAPAMTQIATALGLIWAGLVIASGLVANIGADLVVNLYGKDPAQAASAWLSLQFVVNGLGGGNEIIGGLWVLLISWAGLRAGQLPKALNWLGVIVGSAGLVTTLPGLGELGAVFGLGLIVWFVWLGIVMLRSNYHYSSARILRSPV
jgi:hypothetical protein